MLKKKSKFGWGRRVVTEDAGEIVSQKWAGFVMEFSGTAATPEQWGHWLSGRVWRINPVLVSVPGEDHLLIKVDRVRVRYQNSPLYSETRRYSSGYRLSLHGFENKHTKEDQRKALEGMGLPLTRVEIEKRKTGPKRGTTWTQIHTPKDTAATLRKKMDEKIGTLEDNSCDSVARSLGFRNCKALTRRRKHFGDNRSWTRCKKDALAFNLNIPK